MAESAAIEALVKFLDGQGVPVPIAATAGKSLGDVICNQFHKFDEGTLRSLIAAAIAHRDAQQSLGRDEQALLGVWGMIIDEMKEVIAFKRDQAGQHFQQLVAFGMEGDQKSVDRFLITLIKDCDVDYLFMSILEETLSACRSSAGHEEQGYMITYFQQTISKLIARSAAYQMTPAPVPVPVPVAAQKAEAAQPSQPPAAQEPIAPAPAAADNLLPLPSKDKNDPVFQNQLIAAGEQITSWIRAAAGDAKVLKSYLMVFVSQYNGDDMITAMLIALDDNISACQQAGYGNKEKLLVFMKETIEAALAHPQVTQAPGQGPDAMEMNELGDAAYGLSASTYHAPKFTANRSNRSHSHVLLPDAINAQALSTMINQYAAKRNNKKFKKTVQKEINALYGKLVQSISASLIERSFAVIDNFACVDLIRRVRMEAKLFADHFESAEIWVGKGADVGAHLTVPSIRGDKVLWLCGGHQLLKLEDTKKVNQDIGVNALEDEGQEGSQVKLYEPSSMHTKKEESEPAYDPTMPTTANHAAPEGSSRRIRTHGEIEPCKLQIKAKAPLRRFSALKELILIMDTLVAQLRAVNPALSGLYERSDAMVAVYPGNGARFANHVDNTTNDGRRLTVLAYLNPGWEEALGGALRVTEPAVKRTNWTSGEGLTEGEVEVDVYPVCGRLAMFYSSEVAHEVMPTHGYRYALTIWYYDRTERLQAMSDAKNAGKVHKMSQYSLDHQLEAKEFIAKLLHNNDRELAENEEARRGGEEEEPTMEELRALQEIVQKELSPEAVEIVSSITGAPSPQSFLQGFPLLTTKDLQHMRSLFRRMGLQE